MVILNYSNTDCSHAAVIEPGITARKLISGEYSLFPSDMRVGILVLLAKQAGAGICVIERCNICNALREALNKAGIRTMYRRDLYRNL